MPAADSNGGRQESLPVYASQDEAAITRRALLDLAVFLSDQVDALPEWHPLHHEWSQQLASLRRRGLVGPRGVV